MHTIHARKKTILVFFLFFTLFCSALPLLHADRTAAASKGTIITDQVNVRKGTSTLTDVVVTLPINQSVTIVRSKKNTAGETWYYIKVTLSGTTYRGYVRSDLLQKKSSTASSTKTTPTTKKGLYRYANTKQAVALYQKRSTARILTYLSKNKCVYAGQKKKVGKTTWYKVTATVKKRKYHGYIPAKYLKFQPTKTASKKYKAGVTRSRGGVYKTANGTDKKLTTLPAGSNVIILGELTVHKKKWVKVKTEAGTGYLVKSRVSTVTATVKSTTNYSATTNKATKARQIASPLSKSKKTAPAQTNLNVLGQLTVNGTLWYKASFSASSGTVTGYFISSDVDLSTEAQFQECLNQFPESYRPALIALHQAHANWVFHPVATGLTWANVIEGENVNGRNTIQSNCPKGGSASAYSAPFSYLSTAPGDYDWATDTYTLRDGSNFYSANDQVIAYYMDPRNFLTEQGIFMFEALSYEPTQTKEAVSNMLKDTFMAGNYSVTDKTTKQVVSGSYLDAFMDAASTSNVSPYYLVTRVKNEVGTQGSNSTSGTYKGYEGLYNFYNIGANDSATGQAVANGLSWASKGTSYNRPWTTPYKSITGGASYIAGQYINLGQNTMYTQKFNVVVPTSYFVHQYMTAVVAANSYAISNYNSYRNNQLLGNAYTFYIPYYQDMPQQNCTLPAESGNPNSYLKSLTVKKGKTTIYLDATFDYQKNSYTAVVESTVKSVKISASAISSRAKVSGTGTYNVVTGNNTFHVTCTAENGTKTSYSITITKQ